MRAQIEISKEFFLFEKKKVTPFCSEDHKEIPHNDKNSKILSLNTVMLN